MDTILVAGGIPKPGTPLYPYTQGKPKALLPIAGKPMIQWVLDALSGASKIDRLVVVGLEANCGLVCDKAITLLPDQGGLVDNILSGLKCLLELNPTAEYVLLAFADIPTITAEMVDWVVATASEIQHEVILFQVSQQVMEARFLGARRRYDRLRDVTITPGDLNVVAVKAILQNIELAQRFANARHNILRIAALIGFDTLFYIFLRRFDLAGFVKHLSGKFGLDGQIVLCPYAEVAMDVDKPHHLEIVKADLSKAMQRRHDVKRSRR